MNHYGMPMSSPYSNNTNSNVPTYHNGTPIPQPDPEHKQAIYTHPLFPLLCQVLNKVELAANRPRGLGDEEYTNKSVINDIAVAAQQIQQEYPYYKPDPTVNNSSVDSLMIQAIQVLRINLLELDKVNEYSVGFCSKLLKESKDRFQGLGLGGGRGDNIDYNDDDVESRHSPPSPSASIYGNPTTTPMSSRHSNDDFHSRSGGIKHHQDGPSHYNNYPQSVGPSASTPWGSDPHSTSYSPAPESTNGSLGSEDLEVGDEDESLGGCGSGGRKSQKKRGIFPKSATHILRTWLFDHLAHPYPTEDQKRQLALETKLTILQVNNWFINARRRIVQPLVDQSNRAGHGLGVGMYSGNSHSQAYPGVDFLPTTPQPHSGGYMMNGPMMQMSGAGPSGANLSNLSNPYGHGAHYPGYNYGSAPPAYEQHRHDY